MTGVDNGEENDFIQGHSGSPLKDDYLRQGLLWLDVVQFEVKLSFCAL